MPRELIVSALDPGGILKIVSRSTSGAWKLRDHRTLGMALGSLAKAEYYTAHADPFSIAKGFFSVDADYCRNNIKNTEDSDPHGVLYTRDGVYVSFTGKNEVHLFDHDLSFRKKWSFGNTPGVDSWHINDLASIRGRVCFSCFGDFDREREWESTESVRHPQDRSTFARGMIVDLESKARYLGGLTEPHSPVWDNNELYVCDSGTNSIVVIDGSWTRSINLDMQAGYLRGLAVDHNNLYAGFSKKRDAMGAETMNSAVILVVCKRLGIIKDAIELKGVNEVYSILLT